MELYHKEQQEICLAKFTDSAMNLDNYKESIKDFYRFKDYVKDIEQGIPLRLMDFNDPYIYAQKLFGGTWNDFRKPFVIQIPICNIHCQFCFVDDNLLKGDGTFLSFESIYAKYCEEVHGDGILRISGGEPFMVPEFIIDFAKFLKFKINLTNRRILLWIDTNLLCKIEDYENVVTMLNLIDLPYGIVGCFKGFDSAHLSDNISLPNQYQALDLWLQQFRNARKLIELGSNHIFFYVPEFLQSITNEDVSHRIEYFMNFMIMNLDGNAPLRTTVLRIKEYQTNKSRLSQIHRNVETGQCRIFWNILLERFYPKDLIWLPQSQIRFKLDKV
jgi:uncharacterized Fe-S cluster-containing radical SAM superfamily protein